MTKRTVTLAISVAILLVLAILVLVRGDGLHKAPGEGAAAIARSTTLAPSETRPQSKPSDRKVCGRALPESAHESGSEDARESRPPAMEPQGSNDGALASAAPESRVFPSAPPKAATEDGFILLPSGSFLMGNDEGLKYEKPTHRVGISAFAISPFEVTFKEWLDIMGHLPGNMEVNPAQSAEFITWYEAVDYCNRLSIKRGFEPAYKIDGTKVEWDKRANGYRLPTEAEWEYAARAGSDTLYSGSDTPAQVAVFEADGPMSPGTLRPNAFGLYDMSGNVAEWCWDWWAPYDPTPVDDPDGPSIGVERVFRGGSWYGTDRSVTVSARSSSHPSNRQRGVGLRLVR